MPAGRFKAECLALLDRVEQSGEPVVVTKRGRPVAEVVPIRATARTPLPDARPDLPPDLTTALGLAVLNDHTIAFELLGVLLVLALVGAIYFARPED